MPRPSKLTKLLNEIKLEPLMPYIEKRKLKIRPSRNILRTFRRKR